LSLPWLQHAEACLKSNGQTPFLRTNHPPSSLPLNSTRQRQVPAAWARAAYPSRKPLAAWLRDLDHRIAFIGGWLTDGLPRSFWLPGLADPQGFITAVLQSHARRARRPIDALRLRHRVLGGEERRALERQPRRRTGAAEEGGGVGGGDEGEDGAGAADDGGVVVYGLHLEGARWDEAAGVLAESAPGETLCALPPICLLPVEQQPQQQLAIATGGVVAAAGSGSGSSSCLEGGSRSEPSSSTGGGGGVYRCPVYRTSARSDFVMHLELPMPADSTASTWVLRGAAALCSLDDD